MPTRTSQLVQIRSAVRDLLDLKLSELTTARIERWRVSRTFYHAGHGAPAKRRSREVRRSTINRHIKALRPALNRASEWGVLSSMPLGKIKFRVEDENESCGTCPMMKSAVSGERLRPVTVHAAPAASQQTDGAASAATRSGWSTTDTRTTSRRWFCWR